MEKLNPQLNTGLIIEEKPEDYILGANSPIPHEARNWTRNWRPFRSRPERQRYAKVDAMNCVSQTETNIWEAEANWMLFNNLWPKDALTFWNKHRYVIDGKFEISERFTAKMSGTTQNGNTFQKVIDSIRKDGVVPEWMWPAQDDLNIDKFTWNEYYKEIPQEIKDIGKESLEYFSFPYERIDAGSQENKLEIIKKALEHAPIGMSVATCSPWESNPPVCNANPNHAVTNDCVENNQYIIWDSYDPYEKLLGKGYENHYAIKAVLYPIKKEELLLDKDMLMEDIKYGDIGEKVIRLKQALFRLGWMPDKDNNINFYNKRLADLVFRFQLANVSHVFLEMLLNFKGRLVGLQTREIINQLLSKQNKLER